MRISKRLILSSIFACLLLTAFAQEQDSTSVEIAISESNVVDDRNAVLSSAAFVFDYGKLLGFVLPTEMKYEAGLQLDFWDKLIVAGEYGMATLEPNVAYINTGYVSEGYYYRGGIGYKLPMKPGNNMFLSFRYAQSHFSDKGTVKVASASGIYDDLSIPFERKDQTATWYEVVLSSEKQVWKGLHLGFHVRIRVMGEYEEQEPLDTFSIPGFGRTYSQVLPALNLYAKYAIQW
ncbi:DUF6048 family protein [Reichenbachiella ulvae]|uniref:DUF6048 family protein n=1 Tax=Reichenbachiella ulvae TaxID=2980104 RepID=A0ABT3CPX4_9BACT|nr:DUF6048 family protein [Reichenbachiella ulvae]MCV9385667.1 DUF6048 family protein [Reichenbachiella ulvae]